MNNIIEDFIAVDKCICSGQLIDNITLHWLFDVANFFSNPTASSMRYSQRSMAFWLTVEKLFKGKGVKIFRGYKGEGLGNVRISTAECKIKFAVPSNPVLSKAAAPYRDDATEPGILTLSLTIKIIAFKLFPLIMLGQLVISEIFLMDIRLGTFVAGIGFFL